MRETRTFILVCFSILVCNVFGQVSIRFLIKDLCDDSLKTINWEIIDKLGNHKKADKDGYFCLEKNDDYFVSSFYRRGEYVRMLNFIYHVEGDRRLDSVITIPKIALFSESLISDELYINCNGPCNGICIDYYQNGQKRLEGNFSNGKPYGLLFFYAQNGALCKKEKYPKKAKCRKKQYAY
ncbi:MAG: hypothetical protein Q8909_08915 [Bacteroidota bacterium]|nr:hypothetical protein [Bacteroidota bacterium]